MFDLNKFVVKQAKPLPVVLLLDASTSMTGEPIAQLNKAVADMIKSFASEENSSSEIWLSVIVFNATATKIPFKSASRIGNIVLEASGNTSMGAALRLAKEMIESKEETPSRAYRPTVVLLSDGEPNDDWQEPMQRFISEGRSSKCDRMAVAIGNANKDVLNMFIQGTSNPLFYASDASKIVNCFKQITMSVTTRKNSKNPNLMLTAGNPSVVDISQKDEDEGYF